MPNLKIEPHGKAMIEDFKNKKNNKLKFTNVIWANFDRVLLANICQDPHVLSIKFFVGVFPGDDPTVKKQDAPVIILQVKRDDIKKAGVLTTGYIYYSTDSLCPPPNDQSCGAVE